MKNLLQYLFIFSCILIFACQKPDPPPIIGGCMDKNAVNYDSNATENCCCNYFINDFTPPTGAGSAVDPESPAFHRLIKATSIDGINFVTSNVLITDQGASPNLILKNNVLYLYYTGWTVGNMINTIAVAVSNDYGNTWSFKYCNFNGFNSPAKPIFPDPILMPNGNIRMFASTIISAKRAIICYESTDGTNFNFIDTAAYNPINHIFDSNAFQYNGNWYMYATNAVNPNHWFLSSFNGINFNISGNKVFLDGIDQHFITKGYQSGSDYRFFSSFQPKKNIKSFISSDAINWVPEPGFRLIFGGSPLELAYVKDPAVIKLPDNTYLMIYVSRI